MKFHTEKTINYDKIITLDIHLYPLWKTKHENFAFDTFLIIVLV